MMFREKSISKFYAFALAAVFALTLAGCGGSGGGSAMMEEEMPPPVVEPSPTPEEIAAQEEADALTAAQEGAMAAYMAAMAAVGSAVDPVAAAAAYAAAADAKTASDAAAMAETSAMAMEYQTAAEAARDSAMDAGGTRGLAITGLANKIINQTAIDNAALEGKTGDDVPKPNSNLKARVGAALDALALLDNTKSDTAAVTTPAARARDAVPMGSNHQGADTSAVAYYGADGPSFVVAGGPGAVAKGEKPTSLTMRGGWKGAELTAGASGAGNSRTYANVYTDIKAPVIKNTYAPAATPTHSDADLMGHVAADPEVTGDVPGDGSSFTAMYNSDPKDNDPPVMGMFSCSATVAAAAGCSISVRDGVVESISGYTFRQLVSVGTTPTPDADYLAWGVWLTVPNDVPVLPGTPNAATAGAFASGNDVFEVREALKGTATYNGVASGLYAAGGMVDYFDADVSLMADFGGTEAGDSTAATADDNDMMLLGAVTGTVTNIKAGGMDIDGSLTLKRAPIEGAAANDPSSGGFTGAATGSVAGRAMAGNWGGQFYGPNNSDKHDAPPKMAETEFPTTAAGTFSVSAPGNVNDPIRMLGAFGSWKAE